MDTILSPVLLNEEGSPLVYDCATGVATRASTLNATQMNTPDAQPRHSDSAFEKTDCYSCTKSGRVCDRRRRQCKVCDDSGHACSGYPIVLRWQNEVRRAPKRRRKPSGTTVGVDGQAGAGDSRQCFTFVQYEVPGASATKPLDLEARAHPSATIGRVTTTRKKPEISSSLGSAYQRTACDRLLSLDCLALSPANTIEVSNENHAHQALDVAPNDFLENFILSDNGSSSIEDVNFSSNGMEDLSVPNLLQTLLEPVEPMDDSSGNLNSGTMDASIWDQDTQQDTSLRYVGIDQQLDLSFLNREQSCSLLDICKFCKSILMIKHCSFSLQMTASIVSSQSRWI